MALSKVPSSGMSSTLQPSTIQLPSGGSLTIKDSSGVDTYLSISSTGRVTTPYQPAVCALKTNGSGFVTKDAVETYNDVKVNIGSHYNSSNGTFTCPVAGVYKITAGGLIGYTGYAHIRPQLNGVNISGSGAHCNNGNSSYWTSTVSYNVGCSAGDTLRVHIYSVTNGYYDTGGYAFMTIEFLG